LISWLFTIFECHGCVDITRYSPPPFGYFQWITSLHLFGIFVVLPIVVFTKIKGAYKIHFVLQITHSRKDSPENICLSILAPNHDCVYFLDALRKSQCSQGSGGCPHSGAPICFPKFVPYKNTKQISISIQTIMLNERHGKFNNIKRLNIFCSCLPEKMRIALSVGLS
jgi:hypothetical protein